MPYILPEQKLAVFFSPKAAGTSLRAFMFAVENGFPLRTYTVQGQVSDLTAMANMLVGNRRFKMVKHRKIKSFERLALIRDPVRRILSAYSNRVVHYRELSREVAGAALDAAGLPTDPDVEQFLHNIEGYVRCSRSMERHCGPQEQFLGQSRAYYAGIFMVESLDKLVAHVNRRCGTSAEMPRLQEGGPKFVFADLSAGAKRALIAYASKSVVFDWVPDYAELYSDHLVAA